MKSIYKYSLLLLMALTIGALWSSCTKDDSGKPFISYVRVTNPSSADSLLSGASLGQMLAIMGNNLGSTNQVWFNDQKAQLISTYVTNGTVLVRVPSTLPLNITNKLKLVFANGSDLEYNFAVDVNKPTISYVNCEYINDGDSLLIYGNYFFGDTSSIKVAFTGSNKTLVSAKLLSVTSDAVRLTVKVPTGTVPGPITVTNLYGKAVSGLWFRDNRNIILDFDNMSGSNGQGVSNGALWHPAQGDWNRATSSASGIQSINGNYLYNPFGAPGYGAWSWNEVWTGNQPAQELDSLKNIPQEAFTNPGGYNLKFEVSTIGSLAGAYINIWIGNSIGSVSSRGPGSNLYEWQPNIDTKGKWQTVTIPWNQFNAYAVPTGSFVYNSNGYDISIVMQGGNHVAVQAFAIDNVRVVPNN